MLLPGWRLSLNVISLLHLMRFICSLTDYLSVMKKYKLSKRRKKGITWTLFIFEIKKSDRAQWHLYDWIKILFLRLIFKPRFIMWINTIIIIVSSFASCTLFNIKSLNSNPSSSAFRFFRKISKMILYRKKNESFK